MIKDRKRLNAGDFFHQLHHRYFECNYGTAEMPWDKVFGSFHDGSEEATRRTREHKKQMYMR
jgi:sterol desaturase/sphingolipid hydroxylase (fatty acid hydroxylase superfamily)